MNGHHAPVSCLVIVSSAGFVDISNYNGSVSASSFIDTVEVLQSSNIELEVATPNGAAPEFHTTTPRQSSWLRANSSLFESPISIYDLVRKENTSEKYNGIVFPSSLGGVSDLANDVSLGNLVKSFISSNKVVCAIGYGVTGLCKAFDDNDKWKFSGWNLTSISNFEVARDPFFSKLPLIVEDYIKDHDGFFNCSTPFSTHVIVDRNLVTGQNDASTSLAVKNFAWLCDNKLKH
eukprot:CAMPEP_0174251292 /NCGR_PEP_ID=MMETSP0439-20130205/1157_1 /TAXON_ID=0 /ORGANISM="Stereomyxa ramosa, Strain Chinc5" /LENGTH=233 /DNA_ID=CAMNT_0015331565 /DNA_START=25 /DNA_END=726 /DNA_ORIENTATION=+